MSHEWTDEEIEEARMQGTIHEWSMGSNDIPAVSYTHLTLPTKA